MKVSFSKPTIKISGSIAIGLFEGSKFTDFSRAIDNKTNNILTAAIKTYKFLGKKGQLINLVSPPASGYTNIYLFGLGSKSKIIDSEIEEAGGALFSKSSMVENLKIIIDDNKLSGDKLARVSALLASGMFLRSYSFDKYSFDK